MKVNVHSTTVADLKLRPRQGTTDYVVLSKVDLQETQVDVAKRAVEIGKVMLAGGEVKAWLSPHGELNLFELMAAPAKGGAAPASTAAQPWTISVPDITVDGFKVSAEDRQLTPAVSLVLNPLTIHVAGYNTTPTARLGVTARTSFNGGATLNATAQLAPNGGDTTAHVEIAQLDLSMFQPFIAQRTAMTLQTGSLATQLDLKKTTAGDMSVKGDVQITGLRTVDELQQSFIKWKDLRIAGLQYDLKPATLHIESITARDPYARVVIAPNRTVNVEVVLAGPKKDTPSLATQLGAANEQRGSGITPAASQAAAKAPRTAGSPSPAPAQAAPVMPISIGTVRIINGSANYADFWIQPNFAVGIQTLNGSIDGLSSDPKSRAKVKLEGKVDRYAPVNINGEMNLLAASVYSDIKLSFKGLELTTMTPYSGRFAGYKIDKGKLSVDVTYKIQNRVLTADQRFVVDQLQLGEPVESPDAVHLPLKLAVALLKDRNGVIDVPLPITGSLDDPQFKLGPIIWHAILNLFAKVATAPFAALGHLFGGHGEEMKFVDFTPGSADLEGDSNEKLTALAKALQEHTQLQLDVPLVYSNDLDRPVLAKRRLDRRLVARAHGEKQQAPGPTSDKQRASSKGRASNRPVSDTQLASDKRAASDKQPAGDSQPSPAGSNPSQDPALADPLQHYRLLLAEYQAQLGKDAALPPTAQAIQNAKRKQDAPPVETAVPELEAALVAHVEVSEIALQDLAKKRAQAIEDALLKDGGIDASRVFVINGPAKTDNGKVRLELALK